MKILRIAILAMVLLALVLGGYLVLSRFNARKTITLPAEKYSEENNSPYKKGELQEYIAKLSSPLEEERRSAEKQLAKAGIFASEILNNAEKTATGKALEAITRLRNKQRFSALNELDYLNAFPQNSTLAVRATDIRGTLEKSKATPLGKLVMRPEFENERRQFWNELRKNASGSPHQLTYEDINGQTAIAAFTLGSGIENNFGAVLELSGLDSQQTYADLTARYIKAGGSIYEYDNIECVEASAAKPEDGAHTRTGKNLFFGAGANGKNALHTLIQTALGGASLGAKAEVDILRESLGKSPDMLAVYNLPQMLTELGKTKPDAATAVREILKKVGAPKIGFAGNSLRVLPEQFEERMALFIGDAPVGVFAAFTAPADAKLPLELFDKIPSNALVAATGYVDGAALERALGDLQETLRKANPDDQSFERGPVEAIRELEKNLGIKPGELMPHFKGEAGLWLTIAPGFPLVLPDLGGTVTTESAQKAEALAELLNAGLSKIPGAKVAKMPYKNHAVHVLTPPANLSGQMAGANLNWSAHGNRVYFSSSTRALQTQLNNLEKNSAGLLTRPHVTAALGGFSAEERRGALLFVDMPALLTVTVPFGLVAAQSGNQLTPEQKKNLAQLPAASELFKEFTPVMAFAGSKKDRIETVVHSPLPVSAVGLMVALLFQVRQ